MAIVRVGQDKEFTTIMGAYVNASNGDTLLIDEGIYKEVLFFNNKVVNLIGVTDYPSQGLVEIFPYSNSTSTRFYDDVPLKIKYPSTNPEISMYIEGIKFKSSATSNEPSMIKLLQNDADVSFLNLVFNKCILDASKGLYDAGAVIYKEFDSGYPVNSILFLNCKILYHSDDVFVESNFSGIPVKILDKCVLSSSLLTNIFGSSEDLCEGGTVTYFDVINPYNAFDNIVQDYNSGQLVTIAPGGWIGYQFTSSKIPKVIRLLGDSVGNYGHGFTVKASNTGVFGGEEVVIYNTDVYILGGWNEFTFSNISAYSYLRIYSNSASNWNISEIEIKESSGVDYILTDNKTDLWYGPAYSSYINELPKTHCFSGIVTLNGVPVEREVKLFRRDNDVYLSSTLSSGISGEYYIETDFGGLHNIICSDNSSFPFYNDLLSSKSVPKALPIDYIIYDHDYSTIKTIILDAADNWGNPVLMGLRSVDFYLEGVLSPISLDYYAYGTSTYSDFYSYVYVFNPYLSKIGSNYKLEWLGGYKASTNQRIACVFSAPIKANEIIINNYHFFGDQTQYGVKNVKIYTSPNAITNNDTTYGGDLSDAVIVFDGQIPEHVASDVVDDFHILL